MKDLLPVENEVEELDQEQKKKDGKRCGIKTLKREIGGGQGGRRSELKEERDEGFLTLLVPTQEENKNRNDSSMRAFSQGYFG
jgi:hypothetical protein